MLDIFLHLHVYVYYTCVYVKKRTWVLYSMMKKLYSMTLVQHCMRLYIDEGKKLKEKQGKRNV